MNNEESAYITDKIKGLIQNIRSKLPISKKGFIAIGITVLVLLD